MSEKNTEILAAINEHREVKAISGRAIAAWSNASGDQMLSEQLNMVKKRAETHAGLLERRIQELGGSPEDRVSAAEGEEFIGFMGSEEISDLDKLKYVLVAHTDPVDLYPHIRELVTNLDSDLQTAALLARILQDDRLTFETFRENAVRLRVA